MLNSAFYALNSSYYARWYYMPILVLCVVTCYSLSRPALAEQRLPRALRLTTFLTLTAVVFAVVPGKDDDGNTVYGVLTTARAVLGYLRHDDAGYRDFCAAVAFLPP